MRIRILHNYTWHSQVLAHGRGSNNRDEDGTNDGCELRLSPWEGSFLHDPLRYLSHAQ
jgi:hypothetical protein